MEGIVKWFNPHKAYGFIAGDDGEDYFVHLKALARGVLIREKDRVSFEAVETDRGKQAQNVTLAAEGSAPSEPAAEGEPETGAEEPAAEEPAAEEPEAEAKEPAAEEPAAEEPAAEEPAAEEPEAEAKEEPKKKPAAEEPAPEDSEDF